MLTALSVKVGQDQQQYKESILTQILWVKGFQNFDCIFPEIKFF